ncbi:DEAD/DEAH box helicase [Paraburkholderia sp. BL10I2N1]|uniref:SNF2-related protein n=1 Tax=Paraburkholderia sp. BL10I2N1 TaxID=1938796 RepID=UPI001061F01A|nr:DEAD/DEAH box helicase [Paraburkholderia sp. BL10I2N1]TDN70481.1 helicase-like protein [Paraburkholderia sp. BL10I2N1]
MLVYKPKKALLFRLKNPGRITTVIPTAKLVRHQGEVLVAVPHRPDETQVLRNLGFEAPDSMPLYYEWPGPDTPFATQQQTSTFLTRHRRAFVLNSMGTGKTRSALWTYDYLRATKCVRRVLVVAPLSVLERAWADTVFRAFPHLSCSVLYGSAARRKKLLAREADVYVINIDGLKVIKAELKARTDIDLVIVDEVAMARNQGTDRWKTLNEVINKQCPRRAWGMTGTPTPNEPTDAWAQAKLINPTNPDVPKYFSAFRDRVMRQTSQYTWVARETALEEVQKVLQPSIRFSLDECVDLPPLTIQDRDVELTDEQQKAYNDMARQLAAEYAGGQIIAMNEAVKANKLVQIGCGIAYDLAGDDVVLPVGPRINELMDVIEESEGKVIVFAPFTSVVKHVASEVAKRWSVAMVYGEVKKNARDDIFKMFQNAQEPHVIVADPGTMAHGLTLTAATTITWYAPTNSNEHYDQANARMRRPGQTRPTVIVRLAGSKVERKMYARLDRKGSMQGLLLDMFEDQEPLTE